MATASETNNSCCSSCLDDGRNTVARHYCVDCEMYFCTNCVKYHNKIPALKTHQINNVNSSDSTNADDDKSTSEQGSDFVHSLRCTLHQGQLIDTLCKDHDEVCCGACAVVKHRSCTTVSIAVAVKGFKASPERNKCKEALTETIVTFNAEKEKRVENISCIGKQKQELIETVDRYEEKIITKIKELANFSRKEIRSKYEEHKAALEKDVEALDVVLTTTRQHVGILEQTRDEQLFIPVYTSKTVINDWEMLLQAMTMNWRRREIRFCFHKTLDKHIFEIEPFGFLEEDCTVKEYTATFHKNVNIKQSNDLKDTHVRDVCLMDSGELLVADDDNKKLKRFNSEFQFKDEIKLSGDPIAVCKIDKNEVAVRIWDSKVVHIVSVGQSMQVTSSFTLGYNGNGMTYDAGTGGIFACELNRVSAYSKTGTRLRAYDKDTNHKQLFSQCRQIALSLNKQDIVVTDQNRGLIVFEKSGSLKAKVTLSDANDAFALCALPGKIILAGLSASGVIVQIDKDGKRVGNLIDTKNGRESTLSVVYDRKYSRLIVGGYPSVISVYTLSAK